MRLAVLSTDTLIAEATVPPQPTPHQAPEPEPTQIFTGPQSQQQQGLPGAGPSSAWSPPPHGTPQDGIQSTGNEVLDAYYALQKIKSDHLANMPLEKKLDLVFQKSANAERIAYQALRGVDGFSRQLDMVFKDLSGMIERVAAGKPVKEPDPPGSSIFDEGDPESIFGW